jgi:hypothetical protein
MSQLIFCELSFFEAARNPYQPGPMPRQGGNRFFASEFAEMKE